MHVSSSVEKRGHWVVPFGRNRELVDREAILEDLLVRIPPSADQDDCQRTIVGGLGGVGKTQIALEAAFRMNETHPDCSVFWVPAISTTTFENAYLAVGSARLADYLSFSRNGSILVTTRNHEMAVRLAESEKHIVPVEEMSRDEAWLLLEASLTKELMGDAESTMALLDFLANLPLAVRQASAHMAGKRVSATQYLELCRSSDEVLIKLLNQDFEDRHRYKNVQSPIATTWLISFEHISERDPLAADFLKFMSFLSEKDIPLSLLPLASDLKVAEALGTLKAYGFITQRAGADAYDMHRLVRLSVLSWLTEKRERGEWLVRVLQRLEEVHVSLSRIREQECLDEIPSTCATGY